MREAAVCFSVLRLRHDTNAIEELGCRSEAISVVLDQSRLGCDSRFGFIKPRNTFGRDQKCFQCGNLVVMIQVGRRICDRSGEKIAET